MDMCRSIMLINLSYVQRFIEGLVSWEAQEILFPKYSYTLELPRRGIDDHYFPLLFEVWKPTNYTQNSEKVKHIIILKTSERIYLNK